MTSMTSMNEVTVIEDWYYGSSQDEYNQNMQSDSALVVENAMPLRVILWQFQQQAHCL